MIAPLIPEDAEFELGEFRRLLTLQLNELGHPPVGFAGQGRGGIVKTAAPLETFHHARRVVCDHMGLPYELVDPDVYEQEMERRHGTIDDRAKGTL